MGGHVLRETTSRGLCGLICPSRTSERGGEGDCVKEGGGEEGKCERERALERLRVDPQRCRFGSRKSDCWIKRQNVERSPARASKRSERLRTAFHGQEYFLKVSYFYLDL
jgi:hypothetical protein